MLMESAKVSEMFLLSEDSGGALTLGMKVVLKTACLPGILRVSVCGAVWPLFSVKLWIYKPSSFWTGKNILNYISFNIHILVHRVYCRERYFKHGLENCITQNSCYWKTLCAWKRWFPTLWCRNINLVFSTEYCVWLRNPYIKNLWSMRWGSKRKYQRKPWGIFEWFDIE